MKQFVSLCPVSYGVAFFMGTLDDKLRWHGNSIQVVQGVSEHAQGEKSEISVKASKTAWKLLGTCG
uniref:Uncharacterized protein n=1 Tax=Anguilla anguilla TaxID=7936 RepID=A0A0E9Q3I7_ANGAN